MDRGPPLLLLLLAPPVLSLSFLQMTSGAFLIYVIKRIAFSLVLFIISVAAGDDTLLPDHLRLLRYNIDNVTFWKSLAPSLHVFNDSEARRQHIFEESEILGTQYTSEGLRQDLKTKGYFVLHAREDFDAFKDLPLENMVRLIELLFSMNLPVQLCFLYDEFWFLFSRLDKLLHGVIFSGNEYLRLPDLWAWRIDASKGDRGWYPHRDKQYDAPGSEEEKVAAEKAALGEKLDVVPPISARDRVLWKDGSPKSVTIWIPLTPALKNNSCIHVLPADMDSTYATESTLDLSSPSVLNRFSALPALPGSVFVWNHWLYHFGGGGKSPLPRISLSIEFQTASVPAFCPWTSSPLLLPTFEHRFLIIAEMLARYAHMTSDTDKQQLMGVLEEHFVSQDSRI